MQVHINHVTSPYDKGKASTGRSHQYSAVISTSPLSTIYGLRRHPDVVVIQTLLSSKRCCHPDVVVINISALPSPRSTDDFEMTEAIQMGKTMFIHSNITVVTIPSPESIVMLQNKQEDS
jgi:hypothetical protein